MKKAIRITLILLVGVPLLLIFAIGAIALIDGNAGAASTDFYEGDDGYAVFLPPDASASAPGVLLIHEWWGLNGEHLEKAARLAEEGYVVYVPDAYDGKLAATVPGALYLTLTQDADLIRQRMDGAYQAMLDDPRVDPARSAVAGFCFGGRQAMLLGIRDERPAATAIFYGGGMITDPERLGSLGDNGPVLGIFGEDDASIPLDQVAAFKSALENRGTDYTERIYGGVGHAFVSADNLDEPGASSQAWQLFLGFLEDNLGG